MIDIPEFNLELDYLFQLQASIVNFHATNLRAPSTIVQVLWAVVWIDEIVFPAEGCLETNFVGSSAPERAPFVSFKQNAVGVRLVAGRSAAKYLIIFTKRVRSFWTFEIIKSASLFVCFSRCSTN